MNGIQAEFFYSGVLMRDCEIKQWETFIEPSRQTQEPESESDERSLARHFVSVKSDRVALLPNPSRVPSLAFTGALESLERDLVRLESGWRNESIGQLETLLNLPRQDFWFHSNEYLEIPYIVSTGLPSGEVLAFCGGKYVTIERALVIDADNGPRPSGVAISLLDCGKALVELKIEVCRQIW